MPGRASPWEPQIAPTGQRIPGRASPWELQIAPTGQRMPGRASPWELQIAPTGQRIPGRASPWELQIAPTGQRIPAQGANPGNRIPENRCVLKEHRIRKAGVDIRGPRLCGVPSERRFVFPGGFPGLHPGLVCGAPSAPLTDGVGSVLDREVDELPDEGLALILRNTPRAMPGLSHGAPLGLRSLPAG
jgi:hypothetical protein